MIFLSSENSTSEISNLGAHVNSITLAGKEILMKSQDQDSSHGGSAVLIPYAGRVRNASYVYEGVEYHLPENDGKNSIHGLLRNTEWNILEKETDRVKLNCVLTHEGYPSTISVDIIYKLADSGFSIRYLVRNVGERNAPLVIGSHPYFSFDRTWKIEHSETLEKLNFVDTYYPDGTFTKVDFNSEGDLSGRDFDNCYLGGGTIRLHSEERTVRIDRTNMPYLVIYNGIYSRGKSVAIEPMTGAPDAFNNHMGIVNIKPDDSFQCGFNVTLE